ncbi:DMT family transporter [Nocardia uniformis]|uniref:DMT family transporter n=1 Tax=Nocardia uniformis TaxID=53432 RepID=A0A849BU82_9NOCA|nr:DMT family transporter [Nocardia uniformis]NNH69724.1 DMT family transporter [Nocardia uniformis]
MPDLPLPAVLCAFAAALLFAVSAVAQQTAAAEVPKGDALFAALVRNPRWWAGIVGDGGGFAFQVAALSFGSVLVVQPILVSMLIFALPLAAYYGKRRITPRTWSIAMVLAAALAVFLIVGDPAEGTSDALLRQWLVPLGLLLGLVACCVIAAFAIAAPAPRALLLGTAGGTLFGIAAALTAHVADLFTHETASVLTSWHIYALAFTGATGLYLQQRAYQVGPLSASLPAVTVAEPLAAAVLGITVLQERLRSGAVVTTVVTLAALVMCVAAVLLSRAEAAD